MLEILESDCTDNNQSNTFTLRSQKAIHLLPGERGKILRLELGWEKVSCWSTKAAISLKRIKIDEKLLWRASRNPPTLFRTVPSRPPTASHSPRSGFATPPKTPIAIFSGTGKATDFKFGQYIHRVHLNKSPLGSMGVSRDCPIFLGTPLLSQERVKLRTSNFACTFIGSI